MSDIQSWFQNALIHSDSIQSSESVLDHIKPSHSLTPKARMAIYQRSYYARLLQCMREQYKALCHALGDDLFNEFAIEYLHTYPSESPTLSHLGARFPQYLNATRPDKLLEIKEDWVEFMIDLSLFEWELYRLFDAFGDEGKILVDISIDDNDLHLQLCFTLHKYDFPVNVYYRGVSEKTDPDIPLGQPTFVAMCRNNYRIGIFSLQPIEYYFLQRIKEGKSISNTIKLVSTRFEIPVSNIQSKWVEWKKTWIGNGFFMGD